MKITENINLGGLIFTIDDDALLKLQNYLNSIERNFNEKEERDEILTDIEARIAEIFQTSLSKTKEVVTLFEVDKAIEIIGLPEDFVAGGSQKMKSSYTSSGSNFRKLYRDTEHSILGGVCSGLAHYFNSDPVIIRILFVLLLFFAAGGFIIYIILWIVIPAAINLNQKLEMKGQAINPNA